MIIVKYVAFSIPVIDWLSFGICIFILWNWSFLCISVIVNLKFIHSFLFVKVFYWLYWRKVWAFDLNFICCKFLWKIHCNLDWRRSIIKWLSCYFLLLHKKEVWKNPTKYEVTGYSFIWTIFIEPLQCTRLRFLVKIWLQIWQVPTYSFWYVFS